MSAPLFLRVYKVNEHLLYSQGFNYRNRIGVILESSSQGWNFSFQLLLSTKARELPGITNACRIKLEAISFISVMPPSKFIGQYITYCKLTAVSLFLWLVKEVFRHQSRALINFEGGRRVPLQFNKCAMLTWINMLFLPLSGTEISKPHQFLEKEFWKTS